MQSWDLGVWLAGKVAVWLVLLGNSCVFSRVASLVAVVLSGLGYATYEHLFKCECFTTWINGLAPAWRITALAGVGLGLVVAALLATLATFAAYLYFLARAWSPKEGVPEKYLEFKSKLLGQKWRATPIPVEVRYSTLIPCCFVFGDCGPYCAVGWCCFDKLWSGYQ